MSKEADTVTHVQEKGVLKERMPEWATLDDKSIKFERLSGLTNITYRVRDLSKQNQSLIFKRFSQVEGLIGRQYQNQILIQASEREIGPQCYYADESYRIEEEIPNFTHPTNQQLQKPQLILKVIEKLSQFHQIKLEAIKNKPVFANYILSKQFIDRATKGINSKKFSPEEQVVVDRITSYFQQDKLHTLRKILLPKSSNKMVRLCHNDVNNLNIMVTSKEIYLIDFEYARYNYVAYDIANFISQSSINYTKQTTPFFQFLDGLIPSRKQMEWIAEKYLQFSNEKGTVTEKMVTELADDVERCFGLCNFYWAVWSPMTKNPEISFDYIEHGLKRLERFETILNKFIDQDL